MLNELDFFKGWIFRKIFLIYIENKTSVGYIKVGLLEEEVFCI